MLAMADTATNPGTATIYVSAPSTVVHRADAIASQLTRRTAGVEVRRTDVYRRALVAGLAVIEAELGGPPAEGAAA